ncbi:MAG: hypothetical protein H6Q68_524 [Firmicutes bacterium]|nr:hypothetical protein [Bacillota bacterium]
MNSNLIDFSKFMPHEQASIDSEAAKKYFISEVLPYVCMASLQRLITANASGNSQLVRLEIMRMYVESELIKPTMTEINSLKLFFSES